MMDEASTPPGPEAHAAGAHHATVRSEHQRLLDAVATELAADRDLALATIVSTRGSTYRHAGARLLARADGTWAGNVSGGCLEGEVLAVAGEVIDTGRPRYVEYDLTADEEAIWGWGLGCNGAIDVLVEPRSTAERAVTCLRRGDTSGRPYVVATVVTGPRAGSHLLLLEDGTTAGELGTATAAVVAAARAALAEGAPARRQVAGLDVLLEVRRPPLRLVVCGAGHDAVPLVRFGAALGWRVVVVDDRRHLLSADRFPEATELRHAPPAEAGAETGADDLTSVVVMSHNFLRDVEYLRGFLGRGVAYLGMLGPGRRLERLLAHLAAEGVHPSASDRAVLHGPAGLDLGAEGPDEIAWAICAEVLAVARGHGGGPLRDRAGAIHEPGVR